MSGPGVSTPVRYLKTYIIGIIRRIIHSSRLFPPLSRDLQLLPTKLIRIKTGRSQIRPRDISYMIPLEIVAVEG